MLFGTELLFHHQAFSCDFAVIQFDNDLSWYNWMRMLPHYSLHALPIYESSVYIEQFIDNIEDLSYFNNLENIQAIYHYSIPTTKLAYPEPYVASASFMHSDLWFVHILLYQYWLWFVFIFIVIFFFITFICTVRWCNMRVRPRRETRGVSRSKCGDLITACVPVSWAASIIINESTDAIDYYDGFGTTELVVGIRAYQWGWEYYYPKDIDLNYNLKHNYSSFIGNSLKYNAASETSLKKTNFWRYYQNKLYDQVTTPAHLILLPQDNLKLINFLNFNDIGENTLVESNAFKRSKTFFKNHWTSQYPSATHFNNKYKFFTSLLQKEETFLNSSAYGLQRQHVFITNQTPVNDFTKFNYKSFLKFLNYNNALNFPHLNKNLFNNLKFLQLNTPANMQKYNFLFFFDFAKSNRLNFLKNIFYNELKFLFNNNTDKKKISHPLFKSRLINKKNYFNNHHFVQTLKSSHYNFYTYLNILKNSTKIYRTYDNFSPNQGVLTSAKFLRKHLNVLPTKSHLNFSNNINTWIDFDHLFNSKNSNILNVYNWYKLKWVNFNLFNKLGTNKVYFDSPHSPIASNTPYYIHLNYDSLENTFIENTPSMFQSKEDNFPTYLFSIYWNFWNYHTTSNHRFLNNFNYIKNLISFYLPLFTFYYDYDFRNWQTLELLEDAVWEANINLLTYDEYKDLSDNFYEYYMPTKNYLHFFLNNKDFNFGENALDNPIEIEPTTLHLNYGHGLYNDDLITNLKFYRFIDYSNFVFYNNLNNIDDTYEILKNFTYLLTFYKKNPLELDNSNISYITSSFAFDLFRSNYEDFYWFDNRFYNENLNESEYFENNFKNNRFNNAISLRSTVKNSIVNFNAIQKVFKSRLDDSRSHSKLYDLSNISTNQPFLATQRPLYEKLLGKNKEFFINYNFYQPKLFNLLQLEFTNFLNFPFFDFPFLLAQKSDSARHIWIDWYSKWGFYEVQPSSSSKYSIYGMPYFNKYFEFTYEQNDALNETETYFVRISKARKNYLQNWIYTPFFYAKNVFWNKNTILFELLKDENKLVGLNFQLDMIEWYWNDLNFDNSVLKFLPSISNVNSFTKSTWRPITNISNYYYSFSVLHDILTVREYLYRELFSNTNKLINLPGWLINRTSTNLLKDLKSSFFYNDPIIECNEYSKDIYFNSLEFFNFNILKTMLLANLPTTYHPFINNFYLFSFSDKLINDNEILYKNQYRPLRKGINNMIRLHATGAVALPIEIRLQVLASSKDVIHSWAVPSAGIKIDCVPGYSSHKVMIFLVSGIFWGQCMEICGRYHHWMPIVVYFMKRDLFFLWCTHFVFLSGSNNMWSINDRQFVDYIKVVSYDKNSWINEIK